VRPFGTAQLSLTGGRLRGSSAATPPFVARTAKTTKMTNPAEKRSAATEKNRRMLAPFTRSENSGECAPHYHESRIRVRNSDYSPFLATTEPTTRSAVRSAPGASEYSATSALNAPGNDPPLLLAISVTVPEARGPITNGKLEVP
jgi:hypothetical protein